jgi:hypothetical protein
MNSLQSSGMTLDSAVLLQEHNVSDPRTRAIQRLLDSVNLLEEVIMNIRTVMFGLSMDGPAAKKPLNEGSN